MSALSRHRSTGPAVTRRVRAWNRARLGIWLLLGLYGVWRAGSAAAMLHVQSSRAVADVDATRLWFAVALLGTVAALACVVVLARRLWRGDSTWPLRLAVYGAVALVLFHLLGWVSPRRSSVEGSVSGLVALLATLHLMRSRLKAWLPSRPLRVADILAMNVTWLLVGGELAVRATSSVMESPLVDLRSASPERYLANHRLAPGQTLYGFPANDHGHYDDAFEVDDDSRVTIACIGDSFSTGVVPHAYHFTTVAERTLTDMGDVRLLNFGAPGIGPEEYLLLLEREVLPLKPDLVVVHLFIGNDFIQHERAASPRSARWHTPQSYALIQVTRRMRALSEVRARGGSATIPGLDDAGGSATLASSPAALAKQYPWLVDPELERPTYSNDAFLGIEVRRAAALAQLKGAAWKEAQTMLQRLVDAAGDVPLGFLLIPDQYQVDDGLWAEVLARHADGPRGDLALIRDMPQPLVSRWCRKRDIPCHDLLADLREVQADAAGNRGLYHRQDTHFNAAGNRHAGASYAAFLCELLSASSRDW